MQQHRVAHAAAAVLVVLCSLAVCDQEAAGLAEGAPVAAAPQESEEPQEKGSE